jgi:ClpP class serine protease
MAKADNKQEAPIIWMGDGHSFDLYNQHVVLVQDMKGKADSSTLALAQAWDDDQDEEPEDTHFLLQVSGDIGIVQVKGMLIEGNVSWWDRDYCCGYMDLRNAVTAAINAGCKYIVMNFNTPGGMVRGAGACGDFLSYANKIVPIYSYSDTFCMSGGVWLAVAPGKFYCSVYASVGSIGVFQVASEYTEMDKMAGIKRRVSKSAPLKGLGNPFEKMGAAQAAEMDRGVLEAGAMFNKQVAKGLGLDLSYVQNTLATGQEWFGDKALELKLVQKNISFDDLLIDLQKKVSQNTVTTQGNPLNRLLDMSSTSFTQEINPMKTKTLNASAVEGALAQAAIDMLAASEATAQGEAGTETEVQAGDVVAAVETATPSAEAPAQGLEKLVQSLSDMTDQLLAARTELADAKLAHAADKSKLASMETSQQDLKKIAAHSIQWAFVAAGSAAPKEDSLLALTPSLLVEQHTTAMSMLTNRFGKGGRVTENEAEDGEDKKLEAAAKQVEASVLLPLSRINSSR